MKPDNEKMTARRRTGYAVWLLCAVCILINFVGVQLATRFELPLYLDGIGIVLASAVGGYLAGVIVGFLTNLINGIFDYTTIFYSSISVLIALAAAFMARRDGFKKLGRMLETILLLALIGGGLGSVLTWFLYGGGIGEGISAPLAHALLDRGLPEFMAQLTADLGIDLLDKTVTVLLVALLLCLLPDSLHTYFPNFGAKTLLRTERRTGERSTRGMSLRAKVMLLISAAVLVVAGVVVWISLSLYRNAFVEEETRMAQGIALTAVNAFDAERVDEYMEQGEAAEGYGAAERLLGAIAASSADIEYVYVYKILTDGCHVVFDPDTEEEEGGDPGEIIPFDEAFMALVPDLLAGKEIEPVISNESYGWLLTVYQPVYNAAGTCQCYVGVDLSMQRLIENEHVFFTRVLSLFLGFFILILAAGAHLAEHGLIRPINAIAEATGAIAATSNETRKDSLVQIRALEIATGDEIEHLYKAIEKTTGEVVDYIAETQQKNEQIARLQNGMILVLADLVESRDKCTGNHVRNTAAYTRLILERMREKGLYPAVLTEEYIFDVVNSAPLHDVGTIQIPDALLNKPGRLTDEEFTQMKCHTLRGGEIIDRAIGMISDDSAGYLTEARNLTLYHHERWDGKGYPHGLKGEEIPLSARVMAVADVFDALVARRSYKEGFPFEKAVGIIREESGTHFDPEVVDAFLDCLDEARTISIEANERSLKEY